MQIKKIQFILFFLIFLLFIKIDFRITNDLVCCSDDFDYFSHSETIVEDFDFDYSNQIPPKSRFNVDGKDAPFGFIGSGLLASPFMMLGNFLDNIFNNTEGRTTDFKYLSYSFSSIVYLFGSIYLMKKITFFYTKKLDLLIPFLGSGLIYYAFERYSMTPVYEVFTILLVIYFSLEFYNSDDKNNYLSGLIPISI